MRRSHAPSSQKAKKDFDGQENTSNTISKDSQQKPNEFIHKADFISLDAKTETKVAEAKIVTPKPLFSRKPLVPRTTAPPTAGASVQSTTKPQPSAAPSQQGTEAHKYYTVMYCKASSKKHKTYNDGVLDCSERNSALLDLEGKVIAKQLGKTETLREGQTWRVGSYECEIAHIVPEEEFLSGRIFISKGKTASATKSATPMAPTTPFKSVTKRGKTDVPESVVRIEPRHDPTAAGAIVLNRGHPEYDLKGNQVVSVVIDPYLAQHLRPHQVDGVQFMYDCITGTKGQSGKGCILADEMGLGKSLQSITIAWTLLKQSPHGSPYMKKAIIVCPSSLVNNWANEVKKWLGPERLKPVAIISNEKTNDEDVVDYVKSPIRPLLIISYEMLRKYEDVLKPIQNCLMICDEGHRLKNAYGNKTIQSLNSILTPYKVILTGTPVQNDLEEFYAMVNFVNPGALGPLGGFKRIFADAIVRGRDPSSSPAEQELSRQRSEELSNITSQFILRRTSDILKKYLPPKSEMVVFCRPSNIQATLYRRYLQSKEIMQILTGNQGSALFFINVLRKLCNHPDMILENPEDKEDASSKKGLNEQLRKPPAGYVFGGTEPSGKLHILLRLLDECKQNTQDKFVVVSNYTTTLDVIGRVLAAQGYAYLRLDGSTDSKERQSLVNRFNNPSSHETVFLLSARAGGVGLNLIGANRLVLFDPDWNPATDLQAMARVWRDGQRKNVFIYRFLATGTIEEKIYQRQLSKQDIGKVVVEEKSQKGQFSQDDLRELFAFHDSKHCDTLDLIRSGKRKGLISSAEAWLLHGWQDKIADAILGSVVGDGVSYVHCVPSEEQSDGDILRADACVIDEDARDDAAAEPKSDGGSESGSEFEFEVDAERISDKSGRAQKEMEEASVAKRQRRHIQDEDDSDGESDEIKQDDMVDQEESVDQEEEKIDQEEEKGCRAGVLPRGFGAVDALEVDW